MLRGLRRRGRVGWALALCGLAVPGCGESASSIPPLILAVDGGSVGDVSRLLEQGADPNLRSPLGSSPLREAVIVGDPAKVEVLLEAGALATETLPRGQWTLVMIAARDRGRADQTEESDLAIAHMLVDLGADPCAQVTAVGYEGMTASAIARADDRLGLAAGLEAIEESSCGGPT